MRGGMHSRPFVLFLIAPLNRLITSYLTLSAQHTAQDTDSSAPPNVARETLIGRKPQQDGDVQEAAWGDRLCVNHPRKNGKTGTHEIGEQIYCRDCAVKCLGIEDE